MGDRWGNGCEEFMNGRPDGRGWKLMKRRVNMERSN